MLIESKHTNGTYARTITTSTTTYTFTSMYDVRIISFSMRLICANETDVTCTINGVSDTKTIKGDSEVKFNINVEVEANSSITVSLKSSSLTITYYRERNYMVFCDGGIYNLNITSPNFSMELDVADNQLWKRNDEDNEGYPFVFWQGKVEAIGYWKIDETEQTNEGYPYLWWEEGKSPVGDTKLYLCENGVLVPIIPFINGKRCDCAIGGV